MSEVKREPAKSFKDLVVWQKAHQLVTGVYAATRQFPKEEVFGLTSQFRRSAVSVSNDVGKLLESYMQAIGKNKILNPKS